MPVAASGFRGGQVEERFCCAYGFSFHEQETPQWNRDKERSGCMPNTSIRIILGSVCIPVTCFYLPADIQVFSLRLSGSKEYMIKVFVRRR